MDSEVNYKKSQDTVNDIDTNTGIEANYPNEIKETIVNLKKGIDKLGKEFDTIKNHTLDLATQLNESKLCATHKISIRIKEILKDEIKKGKISSKWIEECLPPEYKRKYDRKEVSSLSKKKKEIPLVVAENSGESFTIMEKENANIHPSSELTESNILNQDLENKNKGSAADTVTKSESLNNQIKEIRIAKERFNEITDALDKCNTSIFIRFNAKGIVESIEPDTIREQQFEKVNDISDDNYT